MTHTPTPWEMKLESGPYPNRWAIYGKPKHGCPLLAEVIRGTHWGAICSETPSRDKNDENTLEREANARFIIEAVNHHDKLVEENRRLIEALYALRSMNKENGHADNTPEQELIRAALGEQQ